jgi:hypothetical protein
MIRDFRRPGLAVAAAALGVIAARAQSAAPRTVSPIVFENVSDASGLSFVLD